MLVSSQNDAQCELDQARELLAIRAKVTRMPGGGASVTRLHLRADISSPLPDNGRAGGGAVPRGAASVRWAAYGDGIPECRGLVLVTRTSEPARRHRALPTRPAITRARPVDRAACVRYQDSVDEKVIGDARQQ